MTGESLFEEVNSYDDTEKVQYLVLICFYTGAKKIFIFEVSLGSMLFWDFSEISLFPEIIINL